MYIFETSTTNPGLFFNATTKHFVSINLSTQNIYFVYKQNRKKDFLKVFKTVIKWLSNCVFNTSQILLLQRHFNDTRVCLKLNRTHFG